MPTDARKAALRTSLKEARAALPPALRDEEDARILEQLVALPCYGQAPLILTYLSFGSEVDTRPLIERAWADGKTVAIPRCVTKTRAMRMYVLESYDSLTRGSLGVLEPDPTISAEADSLLYKTSLAIVPGLAFDRAGYRLGYGGGYYDTFLATFPGVSIGLCREGQLCESLDELGVVDTHDIPVDMVVHGGVRTQGRP